MDGKCITVTMVKMLGSDVKVNNMLLCNNSTKDQEGILLSCMHAIHLLTVLPLHTLYRPCSGAYRKPNHSSY